MPESSRAVPSDQSATVTITVRDDLANPAGVNIVIESEPPYPILPGCTPDVDRFTNAQAWAYAAAEHVHSLTRDPGEFQIVSYLVPEGPPE